MISRNCWKPYESADKWRGAKYPRILWTFYSGRYTRMSTFQEADPEYDTCLKWISMNEL